jgi:hypothetical protein
MSYTFKVGDKGKTRDGKDYVITDNLGDGYYYYPLSAEVDGCSTRYTRYGHYYEWDTPHDFDLMPPSEDEMEEDCEDRPLTVDDIMRESITPALQPMGQSLVTGYSVSVDSGEIVITIRYRED